MYIFCIYLRAEIRTKSEFFLHFTMGPTNNFLNQFDLDILNQLFPQPLFEALLLVVGFERDVLMNTHG